ncbi:tRNA pseudouridine(55) synthase TruB [Natronoglycomyces albus]|uniref:tRNA pseudouridine(55) synthase TruB n=1 Tax=Natronoglycomyces albus TaxID=2811108 RepID=UPI001FEA90D0|nr:tRNA pseudouridine(55) synthase TruB [Natronoglycomyces albus]
MTNEQHGFIIVDKPQDITSHGVVARMRGIARTRKVGHGGTLDPMATGVLVIAVGKATKLLTYVSGLDKSYSATVRLGQSTVTDDAEGDVIASSATDHLTAADIEAAFAPLRGHIQQRPSAVSAIKINGERAYKRVRDGEDVELPARPVTISRLDITDIRRGEFVEIDITVDCSSGTYIRAIARDAGEALGVGGHLRALRRTSVGGFGLDEAFTLETLQERKDAGEPVPLTDMGTSAGRLMETFVVGEDEARKLSFGQSPPWRGSARTDEESVLMGAALNESGELLAVVSEVDGRAKPAVVFKAHGSA